MAPRDDEFRDFPCEAFACFLVGQMRELAASLVCNVCGSERHVVLASMERHRRAIARKVIRKRHAFEAHGFQLRHSLLEDSQDCGVLCKIFHSVSSIVTNRLNS